MKSVWPWCSFGLMVAVIGCSCSPATPGSISEPKVAAVNIKGLEFALTLAATPARRQRGLMGVPFVSDRGGMLFLFPDEKPRRFWMKNCLTALDIIFLDSRGRVVGMQTVPAPDPNAPNAQPPETDTYTARYVIELAPGRAGALGLQVGDMIEADWESLAPLAR